MLMPLEELKNKLQDRNLMVISNKTGVAYPVVYKLSKGRMPRMFSDNHMALDKYFRDEAKLSEHSHVD
jgi:hypothetical protein